MRVALATCRTKPEADPDEDLLVAELRRRGVDAEVVAWDGPGGAWAGFDLCVLRSTWNYHLDRDGFLAWAEDTAAASELFNPLSIVRWNTHKGYLAELEAAGVPITPTAWVSKGSTPTLREIAARRGWNEVVIKPAVSAGSFATLRVDRERFDEGEAHLRGLAATREMMVQRYLPSVETSGERALVWIAGELSHAVRKSPRFGADDEEVSAEVPIEADERQLAERVLAAVPGSERLLYARVDLARDDQGNPVLMELELVEPSLFLLQAPRALGRFGAAIAELGLKVAGGIVTADPRR